MGGRSGHKHPLHLAIGPIAHPAQIADKRGTGLPRLRVERPQLLAALAVDSREDVVGRAIVEYAVNGDRRPAVVVKAETAAPPTAPTAAPFLASVSSRRLVDLLVAGPVAPNHAQLIEVVAIDLVGGGVAGAALIGPVVRPIDIVGKAPRARATATIRSTRSYRRVLLIGLLLFRN